MTMIEVLYMYYANLLMSYLLYQTRVMSLSFLRAILNEK